MHAHICTGACVACARVPMCWGKEERKKAHVPLQAVRVQAREKGTEGRQGRSRRSKSGAGGTWGLGRGAGLAAYMRDTRGARAWQKQATREDKVLYQGHLVL